MGIFHHQVVTKATDPKCNPKHCLPPLLTFHPEVISPVELSFGIPEKRTLNCANLKVDDRACKAYACPIWTIANVGRESQALDQNQGQEPARQRPGAGRQAGRQARQVSKEQASPLPLLSLSPNGVPETPGKL